MNIKVFILLSLLSITVDAQFLHPTNNTDLYSDTEAKIMIDSLYESLKNGASFDSLIFQYSQDPGSYKDYGIITINSNKLDETFKYNLDITSKGMTSPPFETVFGWSIIYKIDEDKENVTFKHLLLQIRN